MKAVFSPGDHGRRVSIEPSTLADLVAKVSIHVRTSRPDRGSRDAAFALTFDTDDGMDVPSLGRVPVSEHHAERETFRPEQGSPLRVISGDRDYVLAPPDLTPADEQARRRDEARRRARREARRRARARSPFGWKLFAAAVLVSSAAAASAFGTAWGLRVQVGATPTLTTLSTDGDGVEELPSIERDAPVPHAPGAPRTLTTTTARATPATSARAPVAGAAMESPASTHALAPADSGSCVQRCGHDVGCILACPYNGHDAGAGMVNPVPTSEQVRSAMDHVRGAVILCALELPASPPRATVDVSFEGAGHASEARVESPWRGTSAGACIERAVRHAAVPRFASASYRVRYPFALR